jgi:hypothetical protein
MVDGVGPLDRAQADHSGERPSGPSLFLISHSFISPSHWHSRRLRKICEGFSIAFSAQIDVAFKTEGLDSAAYPPTINHTKQTAKVEKAANVSSILSSSEQCALAPLSSIKLPLFSFSEYLRRCERGRRDPPHDGRRGLLHVPREAPGVLLLRWGRIRGRQVEAAPLQVRL